MIKSLLQKYVNIIDVNMCLIDTKPVIILSYLAVLILKMADNPLHYNTKSCLKIYLHTTECILRQCKCW